MDVTPLIKEGQQIIQRYAGGSFKISGVEYEHAVFVSPSGTTAWDNPPDSIPALTAHHFDALIAQANDIDVVLFGTGATMQFVQPKLRQELSTLGLPLDIMDTGAACRTYNVLMAEGRRVVAALLPA